MWKGKVIEKVREIKYVEYEIRQNGQQDGQVKDKAKKGAAKLSVRDRKTNVEGGLSKETMAL